MANHTSHLAEKTVMNQVDKEKTIVINGETPRPDCDSIATGKERERESGAIGSNEATGLMTKGCLEADCSRGETIQSQLQTEDEDWYMECTQYAKRKDEDHTEGYETTGNSNHGTK